MKGTFSVKHLSGSLSLFEVEILENLTFKFQFTTVKQKLNESDYYVKKCFKISLPIQGYSD